MYTMLKPLDIVYLLTCMTLNSNETKKIYSRDGHYIILVFIKNLKLAIVLQMLWWGFRVFGFSSWFVYLACIQKREPSFDSCRFLLLGGPLNVIGFLKFEVYK